MLINISLILALICFITGLKRAGIALLICPTVCAAVIGATLIWGDAEDTMQVMLGVPIICIATITSVFINGFHSGIERWPSTLTMRVLLLFAVLLFLASGFVVVKVSVPALAFPSLLVSIAILLATGLVTYLGLTSKSPNAAHVLSTIGASMRQNLPLPMALESAAAGGDDKVASTLKQISKWLVRGCSLSESIERGYPKCPPHALALITAAERINQLPHAFESIEADLAAKSEEDKKLVPVEPYYPVVLLLIMFTIVLLLMIYVIPEFVMVMEELLGGVHIPVAGRVLFGISDFIVNRHGWAITVLPVLLLIPLWSYMKFRRRDPRNPSLSSRIGDLIKWHLPSMHTIEKSFSMVQVAEVLRLSLNAGCTVNDAIDRTLDLDINDCLRKRIRLWLARVEAGGNVSEAARKSRLPRPLAWAFDEKVNQGNTPTILETLESMYRSSYNVRTTLIRAVLSPCITLAVAAIIGFVVYAVYSMPVAIIYHAAEAVYP
ncbi:MAG: type II secretion system F family protein [Planctomycetota bacterium]|jgi:type II secretory pathway component PulF